jgi:hypothetical protein
MTMLYRLSDIGDKIGDEYAGLDVFACEAKFATNNTSNVAQLRRTGAWDEWTSCLSLDMK